MKRISRKDWEYIGKHNYARKVFRPFCSYYLEKDSNGDYKREQRISLPLYIFLLIPVCVIQFFLCCWDGGLKDFELPSRFLGKELVNNELAEKIWNKKI